VPRQKLNLSIETKESSDSNLEVEQLPAYMRGFAAGNAAGEPRFS
jgi:hypothetical protein